MPDCALPIDDAAAAEPAKGPDTPRRGPFRPDVWLNARQRSDVRLAPHAFRAIDVLAVVAVAVIALAGEGSDRLADLAPVILGVLVFVGATPSLGGYRLGRTGGVLVHLELHPLLVGAHYFLSAIMIALSTLLVLNTRREGLSRVAHDQRPGQLHGHTTLVRGLAVATGVIAAVVLYLGTLVTGTGPHAGDEDSARLAFEPRLITFTHVVPVYLIVAAVIIALILGMKQNWPKVLVRAYVLLAGVLVLQALVGYYQYLNNVPILSVAIHMVLSAIMIWAATRVCSISFQVTKDPTEANADRAIARDSDVTEPVL